MFSKISKSVIALLAIAFFILPSPSLALGGGTSQYYDVVFDGEGEAAVIAKLNFQNITSEPLKEISLTIPGSQVRVISIVQESKESKCKTSQTSSEIYPYPYPNPCDPTYASVKFDKTKSSDELKLEVVLAKQIEPQEVATLLLHYKATGYTTKKRGIYNFSFETARSNFDVDKVRVVINVADQLYLKEGKSATNYQTNEKSLSIPTTSVGSFTAAPALSSISSSIETESQGFYKETSGLDPNENFVVKGKYYQSSLWGNWVAIISTSGVLLILIVLIAYILKKEKEG